MRRLGLLVVGLWVGLGWSSAPPAVANVILYQTSFDTDTTDVPGTYSPLEFSAAGYPGNPGVTSSTPTDSASSVQGGVLHISRGLSGGGSSVPWAAPELTLRPSTRK